MRLWLYLRKYGSNFMYSRKSCIQPMFHLKVKPSPSFSGWSVTFGHAVDSSAIMATPWLRPWTTVFKCLKNSMASKFWFAVRFIWHPLARFPAVVQIQHRSNSVYTQAVYMVFFYPVESVADKEVFYFIFAVIKDFCAPVRVLAFAWILVFKKRMSVKSASPWASFGKWAGTQSRITPMPFLCK